MLGDSCLTPRRGFTIRDFGIGRPVVRLCGLKLREEFLASGTSEWFGVQVLGKRKQTGGSQRMARMNIAESSGSWACQATEEP